MPGTPWPRELWDRSSKDLFAADTRPGLDALDEALRGYRTAVMQAPPEPKPIPPLALPSLDRLGETIGQGVTQAATTVTDRVRQAGQAASDAMSGWSLPSLDALGQEPPKPTPQQQPGQVQATFQDGRTEPRPSLQPGETVGDVGMTSGPRPAVTSPASGYAPSGGRGAEGVERWSDLVAEAARAYNLPEATIKGLMEIESGGNPEAVSAAGAQGLMQVMPFHFQANENPRDPRTNIFRGAKVYADALARWGDPDKAAAAYFGAIDGQGNITGATDATGTDGHHYVRLWRAAASKYGGTPPNAGTPTPAPAAPSSPPATGSTPSPSAAAGGSGGADMATIEHIDDGRRLTVPRSTLPGYMAPPAPGVPTMWREVAQDAYRVPLPGDQPGDNGAGDDLMLRGPLRPVDPEASPGATYDPRTADEGPREAGYATPPVTYGAAGDEQNTPGGAPASATPSSAPTYDYQYQNGGAPIGDASTSIEVPIAPAGGYGRDTGVAYGPEEPSAVAGRIQYPNERQLAPAVGRDTGVAYGPAPVPEPPSRWAPESQAALAGTAANPTTDLAPPPGTPTLPGASGRALTTAVNAAGQSQSQTINPLAVYQAISEVPFDVYSRARSELISDAEQGRLTGTDPLAPLRAMGVQFPDWLSPENINPEGRPAGDIIPALVMSGVLPDPADPLVQQGFRLAGRGLGAVGRRVGQEAATLGVVGTAVGDVAEAGGHRALDAIETGAARVGEAWRQGRRVAAEANAADTGGGTFATVGPASTPAPRLPGLDDGPGPFRDWMDEAARAMQRRAVEVLGEERASKGADYAEALARYEGQSPRGTLLAEGLQYAGDRQGRPLAEQLAEARANDWMSADRLDAVIASESMPTEQSTGVIERVRRGVRRGRETAQRLNREDPEGQLQLLGSIGPAPDPEVRIPRAGYAADISPGAEQMVRDASEANAPQEVVRRAEVARKAEDILGADPDAVQRWQSEALAEAPDARAVRGEALRQAEYIDAENADRAIERLREAQQRAQDAARLDDDDRFDVADALLEAAETARAFGISARASTAEGRAAARALNQRRHAITARQAYVNAERARAVGQDAAFAAREAQRAQRLGRVTPEGATRLRILRDKLLEAERHGLTGDGANGRLDAMDARRTPQTAAGVVGPAPAPSPRQRPRVAASARPEVGLGTRLATDVGNMVLGSGAGATAGALAPAESDAERLENIKAGIAVGAVGFPIVGRTLGRRGRGALAAFGPAPTPDIPNRAIAVGSDPSRRYEFRYRVADLRELVPSNLPSGAPNPAFPRELQPRARERVASQLQIDQIARGLEPDALLTDVGRLDSGPMIVGADNIVESGNGRTLALQRAAERYPEQYGAYVDALRRDLGQYGLSEADLAGKDLPVLVRERVSDVDRAAFAQEANNAGLLRMSSFEQAVQDAGNLTDDAVTMLQVGENDTIASALRRTENRDVVRRWVGTLPENERAGVLDASGQLSAQGYERMTNALLVRTYGQGAGERLARTFIESADPTVRNVQAALMASLPDVARAEALIRSGTRDAGLSIADDVAAATEMLARLRRDGIPIREYLGQSAMFDRELSPFQEEILSFLERNQRRQATIREALREYASVVDNQADPNQGSMFGEALPAVSKEEAWRGATAAIEREQEAARAATRRARANGAGLAPADLQPVPEGFAPTGGPEGRLAVEGAPEPLTRPGPLPEDAAPVGGPEGTLRQQVAGDRSVPAGPALEAPRGGPEGSLRQQVVGDRSAPAGPILGAPETGGPEGSLRRQVVDDRSAPAGEAIGAPVTGGPEGTLTLSSGRTIKDVVGRIDEVLANPQAPGAAERLRELHADLQEISAQGFARSSDIRRRLQRTGLLRAGMAAKDADVTPLVEALGRVDPENPQEMRAVLEVLSRPRLIDRLLEYQYVNMLSSPITHAVNISSNAMQIAGRLLLQNPLEFVYSGGRSTGVGAAFQGAARGFREGLGEAGQIMRTGVSSEQVDRAMELGDYGRVHREYLTERFGKAGALLHVLSTRPLAAMDALLGHTAYASAAEQLAQRKADDLMRKGSESVKGMSREQARQHVMANIWDHPEIIDQAGRIEDYTLLRSNDSKGTAWGNKAERELRRLANTLRSPDGSGGAVGAFLANQVVPFFNTPLNVAKQGAERTLGIPLQAGRAARAYARGDVERGAEQMAKATIGAAAVSTAAVLAMGDNLTGDGPTDPGQRAIWELTHRRNSFRVPGTDAWISWEGTPLAIPFGMVAGAAQGIKEAGERSAKKGRTDLVDVAGSALLKGGQGAAQGFASQSFVRALGDQYQLLTGQQSGLSTVASQGASSVSRLVPGSGMVNFLARVADDVERDTGRPQAASDLPEATGARIAARLPGIGIPGTDIGIAGPRSHLDSRLNAYGEPQGRIPPAPYYRGAGDMAGDPITQRLEAARVGAIEPPSEVPAGITEGVPIPLETPAERRAFQEASGQTWRRLMENNNVGASGWSPQAIERLRSQARQAGVAAALREISPAERQRRVQAALRRKAG